MTETAWPDSTTPARLAWNDDATLGYLSFIDPNGELAVIPVTTGDSNTASTERGTNVWHIDVTPGTIAGEATVSPSVHFIDRWHSPNPVTFTLVDQLTGETPSTPVVIGDTGSLAAAVEGAATATPGVVTPPEISPGSEGAPTGSAAGEGTVGAGDATAGEPAPTPTPGLEPPAPPASPAPGETDIAAPDQPAAPAAQIVEPDAARTMVLTTGRTTHTFQYFPGEELELAAAMREAIALLEPTP